MNENLNQEYDRYQKQILVKEIGGQGQEKLKKSKVLVVGAGGLGAPILLYLSAAGIGNIGVVDYDNVELSNLNRQILYKINDIGIPKVEAASNAIRSLNPSIKLNSFKQKLFEGFDEDIINEYDIILDGSDSVNLKNTLAWHCVRLSKVLITGSASNWEGQIFMYEPNINLSCYSCVYGDQIDDGQNNCARLGIVGTVTGIIGSMMANEAIKLIVGIRSSLPGNLFIYDGHFGESRSICVPKKNNCRSCS